MPHTRGRSLQECKPALLAAIASGDRKPWLAVGCGEASFFRWLQKDSQLNHRWYNSPVCLTSTEAAKMKARQAGKEKPSLSEPSLTLDGRSETTADLRQLKNATSESGSTRESKPVSRDESASCETPTASIKTKLSQLIQESQSETQQKQSCMMQPKPTQSQPINSPIAITVTPETAEMPAMSQTHNLSLTTSCSGLTSAEESEETVPVVKSCIVQPRRPERPNAGFFENQEILCRASFSSNLSLNAGVCQINQRFVNVRDIDHATERYNAWLEGLEARYKNQGTVSGGGWSWISSAPKPTRNTNQTVWSY